MVQHVVHDLISSVRKRAHKDPPRFDLGMRRCAAVLMVEYQSHDSRLSMRLQNASRTVARTVAFPHQLGSAGLRVEQQASRYRWMLAWQYSTDLSSIRYRSQALPTIVSGCHGIRLSRQLEPTGPSLTKLTCIIAWKTPSFTRSSLYSVCTCEKK